jgi:hypothetical protein
VLVKTKIAAVTLCLIIAHSVFMLLYVPAAYHATYMVVAEEYTQKPENVYHIDEPDALVSQAVKDHRSSTFLTLEDTQIDELIAQYDTNNFQVNGNYYQIQISSTRTFPPPIFEKMYFVSLFALPAATTALIIILAVKLVQNKKHKA